MLNRKSGKTVFLDEPSGKAERLCITPQVLSRIRKVRRIFDFNNRFAFPCLRALLPLFTFHSSLFTSGMGIPFHKRRYMDEIFPLTTHVFEGREFPVPRDADAHLRHLYGDYMQLPDLNKLAIHVGKLEFFA